MDAVMEVLGGVITSHFGEGRIHAEKLSIRRGLKDAQNRGFENATILLFCVLQACSACLRSSMPMAIPEILTSRSSWSKKPRPFIQIQCTVPSRQHARCS